VSDVVSLVTDAARPAPASGESAAQTLAARLAVDVDGHFEEMVVLFQDRLYALALRMTGNAEDAEEIVQDAFVRAYRALTTYPTDRIQALALRPWLYRITVNVTRNRARGKRPRVVTLGGPEAAAWEPVDRDRDRPEAVVGRAEGDEELGALVASLPARYRAAVVLRHVMELSYEEVAAVLGQPVGTVKSNVHRGLGILRVTLVTRSPEVE
jgi:RNA polymerase sigma-70 factor (ECF subfamily)